MYNMNYEVLLLMI